MRIYYDKKLDFDDVLIIPKRSKLKSRKDVSLERDFVFINSEKKWSGIPIISSNMDTTGTFKMAEVLSKYKICTALHKFYSINEIIDFFKKNEDLKKYVFITIGIRKEDEEKFYQIKNHINVEMVCIDVANGYTETFVDFIKKFREKNKDITIMAGNVVTPEMTEQLILSGVDIVKIGIGNGSVCTTRKLTGVGYPQLSAIMECADAAHGLKGHICCDGGLKVEGDFAKAYGAGADFIMVGGLFAGHSECDGEIIIKKKITDELDENNNRKIIEEKFMKFYGMSSDTAMKKYYGEVAEYRASEGKTVLVPFKGSIENTIKEILGGLRSACTYVGASKLKELHKRTTFVIVNRQMNDKFNK